ncbi:MAG: bacteriorhodopsin-like [Acidobacteriota bacterium]
MDLPTLSVGQFDLVFNFLSLTIATMFATGIFLFFAQRLVAPAYRVGVIVSGVVVFIAGYHYYRIWESWSEAYTLNAGQYVASGIPFNDAYRYADWLITVPLLLIELIAVLGLAKAVSGPMLRNLSIASVAMIALGYPGEVAADAGTAWIFWFLAMIPFLYILYVLFSQLRSTIESESGEVATLFKRARSVIAISWWVYPIAFVLPILGILSGAVGEVGLQIGYSIADITAKAFYAVVIFQIARAKSEADGYQPA